MDTEPAPATPTSILFISLFWILLGTFIISLYSRYLTAINPSSWFGLIPLMIGMGLITIGWGLLTLQTWAYYSAVILSILGLIGSTLSFTVMVLNWFLYLRYGIDIGIVLLESMPAIFFFGFIAMIFYLFKHKSFFTKSSTFTTP